jgi:plasmid stabilization system protein ParE
MAKSKIIWSGRAKKKLYTILESKIRRDKNKSSAISLYKAISKGIKIIRKYPELGIRTSVNLIYGFIIESYIVFYEISADRILVHTIGDSQ